MRRSCLHCSILVLALRLLGCASFDYLTEVTEQRFATAHDCGKCHLALYDEWAGSDHAAAWSNPHFAAATGQYAFTECLACHAPAPELTDQTPGLRSGLRHEGVTCVSCHLQEGRLLGPLDPTGKVRPHPIRVDAQRYTDGRLCGRCHVGTYRQWEEAMQPEKKSCQACHMPLVERTVTQSSGGFSSIIVALEKPVPVRRHVFAVGTNEAVHEMVDVDLHRRETGATLTITNTLPHDLPTGDFGLRVLILDITAIDAQGRETVLRQEELVKELKTAIAPGGEVTWPVDIPADALTLTLRLMRKSYEDQPVLILYEQRITL